MVEIQTETVMFHKNYDNKVEGMRQWNEQRKYTKGSIKIQAIKNSFQPGISLENGGDDVAIEPSSPFIDGKKLNSFTGANSDGPA
jgi:hypothetical protein